MVVLLTIAILAFWWIGSRRKEKLKTKRHSLNPKFTEWGTNQTAQKNLQGTAGENGIGETESGASEQATPGWEEADSHAAALRVPGMGSVPRHTMVDVDAVTTEKGNGVCKIFKPRWWSRFTFHKSSLLDGGQQA